MFLPILRKVGKRPKTASRQVHASGTGSAQLVGRRRCCAAMGDRRRVPLRVKNGPEQLQPKGKGASSMRGALKIVRPCRGE